MRRSKIEKEKTINEIVRLMGLGYSPKSIKELMKMADRTWDWYSALATKKISGMIKRQFEDKVNFYISNAELGLQNSLDEINKLIPSLEGKDKLTAIQMKKDIQIDLVRLFRDGPNEIDVDRQTYVQTEKEQTVSRLSV